jgi:hypothetical protein
MFEGRLNPVATAVALVANRRVIAGTVLGASLLFGGQAFAATSSLISQQDSVVADSIKAEAEDCAEGKEGTIGHSIADALKIHTELASATPNVESLFSATQDCFSGLGSLFDLSGSIPSLGSILASAQAAVLKFAQKKVCTAVQQVTTMVTTPINQAIGKVGSGGSIGDLNGLTNGLVSGGMSQLDPQLGSSYHNAAAGAQATYTVDVNPFNYVQTDFGGAGAGSTNGGVSPVTTPAPAAPVAPASTPAVTPSASSSGSSEPSFSEKASSLFN